jgi:hypothetical protein
MVDPMFAALSPEIKAPALTMLAEKLQNDRPHIKKAYDADPEGWVYAHHFTWGMGVRNLLRDEGFGEKYFGVDCIDDLYVGLVEEALELQTK